MNTFKVGDKVEVTKDQPDIIRKKIVGYVSGHNKKGMRGEIMEIIDDDEVARIDTKNETQWAFLSDLKLVTTINNSQPCMRKKYVLLKETLTLKKGAVVEEACDDGTQGFKVITPEYDKFPSVPDTLIPRKVVTDNPKWFAEVTVMYVLKDKVKQFKKSLKSAVKKKKK